MESSYSRAHRIINRLRTITSGNAVAAQMLTDLDLLCRGYMDIAPDPSGIDLTELTPARRDVMALLMARKGKVVPQGALMDALSSRTRNDIAPNNLKVHISHLRKYLGPQSPFIIETFWGTGYRLTDRAAGDRKTVSWPKHRRNEAGAPAQRMAA